MNFGVSDYSKSIIAPNMGDGFFWQKKERAREARAQIKRLESEKIQGEVPSHEGKIKLAQGSAPKNSAVDRAIKSSEAKKASEQSIRDAANARAEKRASEARILYPYLVNASGVYKVIRRDK